MNNKRLGMEFEKSICEYFSQLGYWVHFLVPDNRGAQPFDIIAIKNDRPIAIECKTLTDSAKYFSIDRLQDNQIFAFEKWIECGNDEPLIFVKHGNDIRTIAYTTLKEQERVELKEMALWRTLV